MPSFKAVALLIAAIAQISFAIPYAIDADAADNVRKSNSFGDLVFDGVCIWAATGEGLLKSCDGGSSWVTYLPSTSFSAFTYAYGKFMCASTYDSTIAGETVPIGEGFYVADNAEPIVFTKSTPWPFVLVSGVSFPALISYDLLAVEYNGDTAIFSANWYGGLSRSFDGGATWDHLFWYAFYGDTAGTMTWDTVPAIRDSIREFVIDNNADNRKFFAVAADTAADTTVLVVGTADGIFSVKGYNYKRGSTARGLTGDWCVALYVQYTEATSVIWASSRAKADGQSDGISFSTDHGRTWDTLITGVTCWNIAEHAGEIFFACEQGLYKAIARDSAVKIDIIDATTGIAAPVDVVISVASAGEKLWVGTDFGIANSSDGGETFNLLFNIVEPVGSETYAFPSPFSPSHTDEMFFVFNCPIAGEVKLSVYDYALEEVFAASKVFAAGDRLLFPWDGVAKNGEYPANAIYFYRIELPSGDKFFGKFAFSK